MFGLCQATEWSALPAAGGWYDQHPVLIEQFMVILREQHDHRERERKTKERSSKKPQQRGM